MKPNEQELQELDMWIWLNVLGWVEFREEEFPHRNGFSFGDEYGEKCLEADMPQCSTDPAAALLVLEKCAEKMPHGIVGIGSPMGDQSVASTIPRTTQGWVVGKIGKPNNFDVEAETLPLAIAKFAKKLFEK